MRRKIRLNPRTLCGVAQSDCFADTLRSACDDRDLLLEPHLRPPARLCCAASLQFGLRVIKAQCQPIK